MKLENGEWVNLQNREPEAEYVVLRNQWRQMLGEDQGEHSVKPAGMPIDQAMEKVLESGVPSRKQGNGAAGSGDSRLKLPTAESSGRVAGQ